MPEIIGNTTTTLTLAEQKYNPTSDKPQSGKAVAEAIAKLLGSAPENLDTLEELAKALNEDENFSASVLAEIAKKADTSYVDNKVANIKITTDDKLSTTSTNPVQNKVVTKALADKVNKENGKGLSTNDFTDALKNKLNGIDDEATSSPKVIRIEFEDENDERIETWRDKSIFNQYKDNGFYYITMYYPYSSSGEWSESALLLCSYYEDGGDNTERLLITQFGEIYRNIEYPEDYGYEHSNVWEEVSVSPYDVDRKINTAIGDIETSLENIIAKYGLGGDSV